MYARLRSASAGRDESTSKPRSFAAVVAACQSVDFPIPASPSRISAAGPSGKLATKASTTASSFSLPTISNIIPLADDGDRGREEGKPACRLLGALAAAAATGFAPTVWL